MFGVYDTAFNICIYQSMIYADGVWITFSANAWLVFETEMRAITKPSKLDFWINVGKFLTIPLIGSAVVFYLYRKYKLEETERRQEKQARKKRR